MMETNGPIPGVRKREEVAGNVPNLFTSQELENENATEPTPEEQDQYDTIVLRGMEIIHAEGTGDAIIESLKRPNMEVGQAIAETAAKLYQFIQRASKSQNIEYSPESMRNAFVLELIPALMDLGASQGLWEIKSEKDWEKLHQVASIGAADAVGKAMMKDGTAPRDEARQFLQAQGVTEDDMVPKGMTPIAGAVRKDSIRRGMGG
jgi:hypothetical protein